MTIQTYRRACGEPHPDWTIIGTTAIRLGKIALVETLRIDRLKRGLSPG